MHTLSAKKDVSCFCKAVLFVFLWILALGSSTGAQEKITLSYASVGGANSIWNIGKEVSFYKKRGLDAEVLYIGSTTLSAAAVLSGHI